MSSSENEAGFDYWQVADARHRFGKMLEAAASGQPQSIRHRNGQEFILVSKDYFDSLKLDLKDVLTAFDFGDADDEFDRAVADLRSKLNGNADGISTDDKEDLNNVPRHQRGERRA